jgi:hypothetical protein
MLKKTVISLVICLSLIASALASYGQGDAAGKVQKSPLVVFNQKMIDGVYTLTDLDDPMSVFKAVFAALEEEVVVYPTENYYYFQFYSSGSSYWGNLRLDAKDRDLGIVHLGYFRYDENGMRQDRDGNEKAFSASDSVFVLLIKPYLYSIRYRDKIVTFRLNNICSEHPLSSSLGKNEQFVGPIFDESGLKFFLIFNTRENHFMYILNESGGVPEYFADMGNNVIMGMRTGFMFYQDTLAIRKILLAVSGRSTDRNNWYDGPFDQLPDNCVEFTNIQYYIEKAYAYTQGNIDRFGCFKDQEGARVVIFPYSVYYDAEEITAIISAALTEELSPDEFYIRITPDPYEMIGKE